MAMCKGVCGKDQVVCEKHTFNEGYCREPYIRTFLTWDCWCGDNIKNCKHPTIDKTFSRVTGFKDKV